MVTTVAHTSELAQLTQGLDAADTERLLAALELAQQTGVDRALGTGEPFVAHALGMAAIAAELKLDADSRIAALLFFIDWPQEKLTERFGEAVAGLVISGKRLIGLRVHTQAAAELPAETAQTQVEVLRKMLLGMAQDVRVVLLRLASRTQTLRYFAARKQDTELRRDYALESLNIYAPLANRLGVWQLKWELEDFSFRFLEPEQYHRIAKLLDERRVEREAFIQEAVATLRQKLKEAHIEGEVTGRPKHIYSIYNKMRQKNLDFSEVYDIRAARVLVPKVRDCYVVLDIVNQLWQPIAEEYDDYISRPKGNNYQSLHTAVYAGDGRALEVQIRTFEMHRHAEFGVAAHWRYKEKSTHEGGSYDEQIALLRSLLSWRDEAVRDATGWVDQLRSATLNDTIYVLTPQGRVIDLQRGATPIDFAYALHSELGHRCRGAKLDGQLVPLNTPLENGQRVEIITAREGGPSRDWMQNNLGYVRTRRARSNIRQYFSNLEEEEQNARGRAFVTRELAREGLSQANIEQLAAHFGFRTPRIFFLAAGRGEIGPRVLVNAARSLHEAASAPAETSAAPELPPVPAHPHPHAHGHAAGQVLVHGVGKLMTTLGRCCKPAPPEPISGFVTRGRGVSIHRTDCRDFQRLAASTPERVVTAQWNLNSPQNRQPDHVAHFAIDMEVFASDRPGLLRDITEVLSREKINVTAAHTHNRRERAHMRFTLQVTGIDQMQRAFALIGEIPGVTAVHRSGGA